MNECLIVENLRNHLKYLFLIQKQKNKKTKMKHKVQHNTTHPYFFNNQNTNENIIFNTKYSYKKKKIEAN